MIGNNSYSSKKAPKPAPVSPPKPEVSVGKKPEPRLG